MLKESLKKNLKYVFKMKGLHTRRNSYEYCGCCRLGRVDWSLLECSKSFQIACWSFIRRQIVSLKVLLILDLIYNRMIDVIC